MLALTRESQLPSSPVIYHFHVSLGLFCVLYSLFLFLFSFFFFLGGGGGGGVSWWHCLLSLVFMWGVAQLQIFFLSLPQCGDQQHHYYRRGEIQLPLPPSATLSSRFLTWQKKCGGFFLACEDFERMFGHSVRACASSSYFFFFFLKWKLARAH